MDEPSTGLHFDDVNKLVKILQALVDQGNTVNEENTKSWLMAPNTLLFGDSPFIVCLRGEGDKLIEWLNQRLRRSIPELAS